MQTRRIVASIEGHAPYDIRVGRGVCARLGKDLATYAETAQCSMALIITDAQVGSLYAQAVSDALRAASYTARVLTIPAGEASKSIEVATELWRACAQLGCGRDAFVVALGGGVVSDLAGFVAATYMRGVPVVHVPTSLLAMIDASVGGKTALDLPEGKNLVGAFKQPAYVCADLDFLESLPEDEWTSGFAELAKMAVVDSDEFYFWLLDHAQELGRGSKKDGVDAAAIAESVQGSMRLTESASGDSAGGAAVNVVGTADGSVAGSVDDVRSISDATYEVLAEAISRALVAKVRFVAQDEHDTRGMRALLNYGHTLGHALEQQSGYTLKHGHAVAEGMRFAARLAVACCGTPLELALSQDELLDTLGIPRVSYTPQVADLLAGMHRDKKAAADAIRFVLPRDVGDCVLESVDDATLSQHLSAWAAQREN